MQFRIPVATLPGTYADGEVLTADKLNLIVNVLREGVNANYNDYLKLVAGTNQVYAARTLEALQTIGESLGEADDGIYGLVLNGIEDEESPDIETLMVYQFDADLEEFVQVFDDKVLSFISILEAIDETNTLYEGIVEDFPEGIKDVTDSLEGAITELQNEKVDKEEGKALSTEDFTTARLNKLNGIATGAQVNVIENIQVTGYGLTPNTPVSFTVNTETKTASLSLAQKADLDAGGKIPANQLPSFVDQIVEYANLAAFPTEGVSNRLYVALDTNRTYRWTGTQYAEVSESLALGTTDATAFRGDLGNVAYQHSQTTSANPHNTSISQLVNVTITNPANDQVLKYNGVAWINTTDTDTNNYPTGIAFDVNTGVLSISRNLISTLTYDIDGRYYVSLDGKVPFSDLKSVPTTLAGYGITDAAAINHNHTNVYAPVENIGTVESPDWRLPASYVPPLAITQTYVVASLEAQNALTVQTGDVAIRTDINKSFIYDGSVWQELRTPTDLVLSVNGKTGAVSLNNTDVGAPSSSEFSTLNTTVGTFVNTTYPNDKGVIESDITALEGRATALETDSHTHTNKSTLDGIVGVQTSISSQSSTENDQLATIGAIKNYVGNPDSTWQGQANFLRDGDDDYYPDIDNTPETVVIRDENGKVNIGYDNTDSTIVATTYKTAIDELDLRKANVSDLSSNINLFPTTAAANIEGYNKLVTNPSETGYDTTAADVSTGAITVDDQLVGQLISEPGLFVGNPGIINITTIGNIKRTAGNANQYAAFYFKVFQRNAAGTETLIATSNETPDIRPLTDNVYEQFSASALLNNGTFISTDRIVIRFYANLTGSSGAVYSFQFGGSEPVRTLIPVPVSVIPSDVASDIIVDASGFEGILSEDDVNVQHALETLDTHNHDGVYQPVGDYATNTYVNGLLAGADAMIFKGTIGTGGTVTALPTAYNAGWTFKVITAGTYAAKNCEVGDMLLATVDRAEGQGVNGDWAVIQTNIDGAVTGPTSSTDNHVAIFDGVTGKIIKDSGFTLGVSVPSNAVFTDTIYTHPTGFSSQPETALTGANVISQVTVNSDGHVTGTSTRALTPSDIGAASSSDLSTLSSTVDGKVTANANITGATHTKITYDAKGLVTAGTTLAESDIPALPISKVDNLQTTLNTKAVVNDYTTTISSLNWGGSTNAFTKTVSLAGITSNDKPIIDLDVSEISAGSVAATQTEWGKIYRAVTGTNEIVFYALEVPTVDLPITVKVVK
jgi:hypothetical protein